MIKGHRKVWEIRKKTNKQVDKKRWELALTRKILEYKIFKTCESSDLFDLYWQRIPKTNAVNIKEA